MIAGRTHGAGSLQKVCSMVEVVECVEGFHINSFLRPGNVKHFGWNIHTSLPSKWEQAAAIDSWNAMINQSESAR